MTEGLHRPQPTPVATDIYAKTSLYHIFPYLPLKNQETPEAPQLTSGPSAGSGRAPYHCWGAMVVGDSEFWSKWPVYEGF